MGACKENINEMQQIIHLFSSSPPPPPFFGGWGGGGEGGGLYPPPLKMNICIKKLFSQRFYDTSYWYHKSCEGVGGLILEVGTFGITFFGFAMHTHQACLNDPPPPTSSSFKEIDLETEDYPSCQS
jgi:hypothetical protein